MIHATADRIDIDVVVVVIPGRDPVEMDLDSADDFRGELESAISRTCADCGGTGTVGAAGTATCTECHGRGWA